MQISEYRVTMVHDAGTVKIVVTASSATKAVDAVVNMERAPRRSARLVETRPLQFERNGDDTWAPVPGEEWGRVDDQPANVDVHTNPFAPDPSNKYRAYSSEELETRATYLATLTDSASRLYDLREEQARRLDVEKAVELWERLCAVDFVRGETQGYYTHSTCHLTPDTDDFSGSVKRMPNREELEALVLSDGEETAYPPHDVEHIAVRPGPATRVERVDTNPWSRDDRLYPVTLTLISCGDYHGSDLDAANNRALDGVPGVEVREPNTGGMGSVFNVSTTIVGAMTTFENSQTPADWNREPAARRADALMWLESLVEQMESLIEYGLLDDEKHSELIDELAEEAWSDHLESDTIDTLKEMAPEDGTTVWEDAIDNATDELKESIRDAYFAFEENEWSAENATSVANARHKDAIAHVARTVFGWNVP